MPKPTRDPGHPMRARRRSAVSASTANNDGGGEHHAETLRALLNAPTEARLLIDTEGIILALNAKAHERLEELAGKKLGRRPERLLGACVYDLFPPNLAVERQARNAQVLSSGTITQFEDERDGRWMDNTICPVVDDEDRITSLAILSRDVTDLKTAQERAHVHAKRLESINAHLMDTLDKLAHSERQLERALEAERERARRDTLTGVLNHGAIVDELRALVLAHADDSCAVAMVDVDGMKGTNDLYGHLVGDEVLVLVARALSRGGALVGRYGGDEFIALLPRADRDEAHRYCHQVAKRVQAARVVAPDTRGRVPVFVSIGFAVYPHDGDIAAELIRLADEAMYLTRRQTRLPAERQAA